MENITSIYFIKAFFIMRAFQWKRANVTTIWSAQYSQSQNISFTAFMKHLCMCIQDNQCKINIDVRSQYNCKVKNKSNDYLK